MFRSFLDHPQANIFQQEVKSVRTVHYGIPYCLQRLSKNNYKRIFFNFKIFLEQAVVYLKHYVGVQYQSVTTFSNI